MVFNVFSMAFNAFQAVPLQLGQPIDHGFRIMMGGAAFHMSIHVIAYSGPTNTLGNGSDNSPGSSIEYLETIEML